MLVCGYTVLILGLWRQNGQASELLIPGNFPQGFAEQRNGDEVVKHRQGPRSHPRLTWDPAMSRVAAISGSRIRLPGERAGKAASRQRYRRRKAGREAQKQALPTPQGWSSGRPGGWGGP